MKPANILSVATLVLILSATPALVAAQGLKTGGGGGYKASELVCRTDSTITVDEINDLFGTVTRGLQTQTDCYLLSVTGGRDAESLSVFISQTPGVVYCSPNYYVYAPEGLQTSSAFPDLAATGDIDTQPAVDDLQLDEVRPIASGTGVVVAVVDGGVNLTHPYFADDGGQLVSVWDYVDDDADAVDVPGGANSGHGTFVAGIIHLVAPEADLYVYRVLDSTGCGDGFTIATAVLRAIEDGCQVINLSLGMSGMHDGLDDALKLARDRDVLVVTAAGNDSTDAPSIFPFPASREYCIAVAALDSLRLKADFSNYGVKVDVCAPGTRVYAPYLETLYAWWDGTSFSTPFVTGLAALLKQTYPLASWDDLNSSIRSSATNVDALNPTYVGLLGAGQVNPLSALGYSASLMRGDLNGDERLSISDVSYLISFLFIYDDMPNPGLVADVNCDDEITISDISLLIAHLFIDGSPLCSGQ